MTGPAQGPSFADRTTLRVGGPADEWITARSDADLIEAVRAADAAGTEVVLVGGGSNLLVADAGHRGVAVEVATRGIGSDLTAGPVQVWAAAGEPWTGLVDLAVRRGWSGIEAMAGIPGRVGATPVQNVGAYGQDVGAVLAGVRAYDRCSGVVVDLGPDECGFGYRTSRFKVEPHRWVVLGIGLRLQPGGRGVVRYAQLADALGVAVGDEADVAEIRRAVLALRAGKAMVLDPNDHDTWSAGSFFTNPIVSVPAAAAIPDACPRYPALDAVKLSAAWLIENSGIGPGHRLAGSHAAISSRHTLALTNRGGATAVELVDLARAVRASVRAAFGIDLDVEPTLVGVAI